MVKKAASKKRAVSAHSSSVAREETSPVAEMKPTPSAMRNWLIPAVIVVFALGYMLKSYVVAATVNGTPVTRLSVIKELEKQGGKKVLDALVTKTLVEQEAKKQGIKVSDKEVNDEISKIEKNITAQGMTLEDALKTQGMTKQNLKEEITLQLVLQKLVGGEAAVTDKEVDEYIAAQVEQMGGEQTEEPPRDQVRAMLQQQKQQERLTAFLENLKKSAKVNYFVQY